MLDLRDFGGVYLISYWNTGDYKRHEEQNFKRHEVQPAFTAHLNKVFVNMNQTLNA